MRIALDWRSTGMALLLGCGCALSAAAVGRSPAEIAYEQVSEARERHGGVIWGAEEATPEQLRGVVRELQASLGQLDTPLNIDLAEGSVHLRYRRYNILIDLVKLHARLGDKPAALEAWQALQRMQWAQGVWVEQDPAVAALLREPEFRAIRQQAEIGARLGALPQFGKDYVATLPVEQRLAGLALLWTLAREHFVWFDQVPELDWDAAYVAAIPQVIAAGDTADYYRVLMRLVARLQDGHSNVYYPAALATAHYARPPLRTGWIGGGVYVLRVASPRLREQGIAVGDELVTIDGQPVLDYAREQIEPFVSASTEQDRRLRTFGYQLLAGDSARPVRLGLRAADGQRRDIEVARSGYEDIEPRVLQAFNLREDGIAVLSVGQFEDDAALKLLEANIDALMGARGLVIDLRYNGGGSGELGFDLLSYLDAKPVPLPRSFVREADPYDRVQGQSKIRWRALDARERGTPTWEVKRERIFTGPVVMLIDAGTFSAAEDTAAAFKLMQRGPILGSASGGSTGQPMFFDLPGGGSARICIKRDEYPDGTSFVGVGVLPDLVVEPSVQDLRSARDPVLVRAVEEVERMSATEGGAAR